ncbi:MAG: radical SAM protein [Deltaproteobacteria bacterium]|nr:radical SAM protein [Deltaproteobacteria bacterium]
MRITLAYRGRYLVRQALELESLSAVLQSAGHAVSMVYDPGTFGVTDNVVRLPALDKMLTSPRRTARRILATEPDLVVLSVLPQTREYWAETVRLMGRSRAAPLAATGLLPTLCPEAALASLPSALVVCGETEAAVPALAECIEAGRSLEDVPNLWWEAGGQIRSNPPAPLVDLDALPLPDKDLFSPWAIPSYSYAAMVSRGCSHRCSYCEETCMAGRFGPSFFRRKSVDRVLEELTRARNKYRFSEVIFKDSYLSGDERWLAALMEGYKKEVGLPFKCFATIQGFTAKTARLLAEGGCYCVEFGLQTWNEGLRRRVLNRTETNEQAMVAFSACAEHGLWYDVDHLFNIPGETVQDHQAGALTYRSLSRLNRIKPHFLVYLPGAPIVDKALSSGHLDAEAAAHIHLGMATDFYDQALADPESARMTQGYANLYKVLPALPKKAVEKLSRPRAASRLSRLPQAAVAPVQALLALRSADRRFFLYERSYPAQAARTIWSALRNSG